MITHEHPGEIVLDGNNISRLVTGEFHVRFLKELILELERQKIRWVCYTDANFEKLVCICHKESGYYDKVVVLKDGKEHQERVSWEEDKKLWKENGIEWEELKEAYKERVVMVPKGHTADWFILDYADKHDADILSADCFREHENEFTWLKNRRLKNGDHPPEGRCRRHGIVFVNGEIQVPTLNINLLVTAESQQGHDWKLKQLRDDIQNFFEYVHTVREKMDCLTSILDLSFENEEYPQGEASVKEIQTSVNILTRYFNEIEKITCISEGRGDGDIAKLSEIWDRLSGYRGKINKQEKIILEHQKIVFDVLQRIVSTKSAEIRASLLSVRSKWTSSSTPDSPYVEKFEQMIRGIEQCCAFEKKSIQDVNDFNSKIGSLERGNDLVQEVKSLIEDEKRRIASACSELVRKWVDRWSSHKDSADGKLVLGVDLTGVNVHGASVYDGTQYRAIQWEDVWANADSEVKEDIESPYCTLVVHLPLVLDILLKYAERLTGRPVGRMIVCSDDGDWNAKRKVAKAVKLLNVDLDGVVDRSLATALSKVRQGGKELGGYNLDVSYEGDFPEITRRGYVLGGIYSDGKRRLVRRDTGCSYPLEEMRADSEKSLARCEALCKAVKGGMVFLPTSSYPSVWVCRGNDRCFDTGLSCETTLPMKKRCSLGRSWEGKTLRLIVYDGEKRVGEIGMKNLGDFSECPACVDIVCDCFETFHLTFRGCEGRIIGQKKWIGTRKI